MRSNIISTLLKGICVGGTMLVPGVSGGSMAMILGIYDKLVSSVSSFMKHKRQSFLFLSVFALGGLVGMVLFAQPLLKLIETYRMPMLYFFIGTVAGSVPMIYKKAHDPKISYKTFLYPLIGFLIIILFSIIPADMFHAELDHGFLGIMMLIVAGIVAAVALVLPGISVSYMLLLMGMYDEFMRAVSDFYFPFLIPLGIGLMIGIVATTKILEKAMNLHPRPTYLIILGFILGSIIEIFPGIPNGFEFVISIVMLLSGFFIIRVISK